MANSKYEYVRAFERDDILLPNTWIVVRVDGRGFHRLSKHYNFIKPNDSRALNLMNAAAASVLRALPDVCVAYGVSDEFSFVFDKDTALFERRAAKIVSTVVSAFTAAYVFLWGTCFKDEGSLGMGMLPTFDGRAVCYPSLGNLRDYLSWRQVDCHINNLYNTTFWTLVQTGGLSPTAAEEALKGTVAADKNEILFSRFGINYNDEEEMFRKGSVVFRELESANAHNNNTSREGDGTGDEETSSVPAALSKTQSEKMRKARAKAKIVVQHVDIIKDEFWELRPWILGGRAGKIPGTTNKVS